MFNTGNSKGYAKAESKFVYALECIEHSDAFIEHEVDLSAFNTVDKPNRVENAVERLENRLDKLNGWHHEYKPMGNKAVQSTTKA